MGAIIKRRNPKETIFFGVAFAPFYSWRGEVICHTEGEQKVESTAETILTLVSVQRVPQAIAARR